MYARRSEDQALEKKGSDEKTITSAPADEEEDDILAFLQTGAEVTNLMAKRGSKDRGLYKLQVSCVPTTDSCPYLSEQSFSLEVRRI